MRLECRGRNCRRGFLERRLPFLGIAAVIERVLERMPRARYAHHRRCAGGRCGSAPPGPRSRCAKAMQRKTLHECR